MNPSDQIIIGFLVEPHLWDRLQDIKSQLHNGTDKDRDLGHKLWLVLKEGMPVFEGQLK